MNQLLQSIYFDRMKQIEHENETLRNENEVYHLLLRQSEERNEKLQRRLDLYEAKELFLAARLNGGRI